MSKTIVLYPRSYNKRGEESKHSVIGITPEGNVVNIKLRLSEASSSHENPPSIAEFSRNDRKAKLACQADENNSPDNRFGVLLFSHCTYEGSDTGIETWIARWANVLAVDADSPDPIFGVGRISINTRTNGILSAERNIERLTRDGLGESAECEKFKRQLLDRTQYQYSAVIFKYEKKKTFRFFEKEMFLPVAEDFVDKHTFEGITGGFFITINGKDGSTISQEVFSKYIMSIQRYQTGLEAAKSYLEGSQSLLEGCGSFSVVPLMRINCGPRGNSHYGQSHKYQQICNLFRTDEGIWVRNFVVRVSYFEDTKNTLLSRYYALDTHVVEGSLYEPGKISLPDPEEIDSSLTPINYIMGSSFPLLDINVLPDSKTVCTRDQDLIPPDSLAKDPDDGVLLPPLPSLDAIAEEPESSGGTLISHDAVAYGEKDSLLSDVQTEIANGQLPQNSEDALVEDGENIDASNSDVELFAVDSVVSGTGREIFDDFVNLILENDEPVQVAEDAPPVNIAVAENCEIPESIEVLRDIQIDAVEVDNPPERVSFDVESELVDETTPVVDVDVSVDENQLEAPNALAPIDSPSFVQDQLPAVMVKPAETEVKPKLTGMAAFFSGRDKAS